MNKIKKTLYNLTRNYAKKYLTGNLGKVIEDDEKITCYVKRSKVKKKDYQYTIACFGIIKENQKKIAETYNLNKPICYVIDGIELKKHKVYILGYNNCEVIIKNCNFGLDAYINIQGKCTLDNTNIITFSYLSIGANELTIKNMNSDQIRVISYESNIVFGAQNKINIIASNIGTPNKKNEISFYTKELNISNSNIYGRDIICESRTINTNGNTSLVATNQITLKTDEFNLLNINSPSITLNEEEIETEKESIVLKKTTDELTLKRMELTNLLRKIKNECENINSQKVYEYQEQLNEHPISKVLKK